MRSVSLESHLLKSKLLKKVVLLNQPLLKAKLLLLQQNKLKPLSLSNKLQQVLLTNSSRHQTRKPWQLQQLEASQDAMALIYQR